MQLNSLSLNSHPSPTFSEPELAIYDHKLAMVNTQVFVYGKNIQNFTIQTPLHKINLITSSVQPVFTVNAPSFEQFMMFSFQQHIYFWGKTAFSQENGLFEFDGLKFTKMDQFGSAPRLNGPYSLTKFSHHYVLLFGCLSGIQFLNKWYLFDIKKRQWKQIVSAVQIPVSQKSDLIWKNGRGYLLLQNCYDKTTRKFNRNLLYEVKFQNFNKSVLELKEIPLTYQMKELNTVFTKVFSFDDNYLMILGGQQVSVSDESEQFPNQIPVKNDERKFDLKNKKIIFKFDLESFQWSNQYRIVPIEGQNHEFFTYKNQMYFVGGTSGNSLLKKIQSYDFKTQLENKKFPYEQSLCYYCECAFTYEQKLIYAPAIEQDYEMFVPKNRVENKFLKKFSQSISTELHAVGMLCEYLMEQKGYQIQINLCQQFNLNLRDKLIKGKIEQQPSQILVARSMTHQSPSLSDLIGTFTGQSSIEDPFNHQNLSIHMTKMKLASFKLGYGVLYVTSTEQGHIFVSYGSYSQTQFPQSNFKSFSDIYYTLKWNKQRKLYEYSSQNKRNIIFQNVKLHFGTPQVYQTIQEVTKKGKSTHFVSIYVIGVTNLEKTFHIELSKNKYLQDIKIKSLNKKNPTNSLRKYLKHLYLAQSKGFRLYLQNSQVEFVNTYQKFQDFSKVMEIKEISTNDDTCLKKTENEETHFSTNQEEIMSWKKIDLIEKCRLYQISKNQPHNLSNIYNLIFVYYGRKLLKTIQTKKSMICGVIELIQSVEVQLDGGNFAHKSDERRLLKWIEQIENTIIEMNYLNTEEV